MALGGAIGVSDAHAATLRYDLAGMLGSNPFQVSVDVDSNPLGSTPNQTDFAISAYSFTLGPLSFAGGGGPTNVLSSTDYPSPYPNFFLHLAQTSDFDVSNAGLETAAFELGLRGDPSFSPPTDFSNAAASQQNARFTVFSENEEILADDQFESSASSLTPLVTSAEVREVASVPEPATWGLMVIGLGAIAMRRKRGAHRQERFTLIKV